MTRRRRPRRPDRVARFIAPMPRFAAGILALPPFLMLDSLAYRVILVVLFALAAVAAGKRIRWGYFIILSLSVTFFHLLAPVGRVLAEIGPLTISAGALENGLKRSLTLAGMVFLSLAAVRPELELPGRLGGLLGRTFYHFEAILDGRNGLERKNFLSSLDSLLLERFDPREADFGHSRREASSDAVGTDTALRHRGGWINALLFSLVPWILLVSDLTKFPWK